MGFLCSMDKTLTVVQRPETDLVQTCSERAEGMLHRS